MKKALGAFAALPFIYATMAMSDPASIEDVSFQPYGGSWTVAVTLFHADTGWDNYADGWRLETPDGAIIATRVLAHPHVHEQPFTRSLGGVAFPTGLTSVVVRASTSVEGWAADAVEVPLPGF